MDCADKISTLQERATIQVAISLCQRNSFKELALCLAKPTYGYFSGNLFFAGDQENHPERPYVRYQVEVALEEECQRLAGKLPPLLRDRVGTWINRMALELQSYRCRMELLFGVSCYSLMAILSIGDWKKDGRLDEKKVALRLLEDKHLTVFQKYQIACTYCLHAHIPELWKRLTIGEVSCIIRDINICREKIDLELDMLMPYHEKKNIMVLFWSDQIIRKEKMTEREVWISAVQHAMYFGNRAAVAVCWERLNEQDRRQIVVTMALQCLRKCADWRLREDLDPLDIEQLEEISWPDTQLTKDVFNLRSHYAILMLFFLSQMDEDQKLTLFEIVFPEYNECLECFLHWPLQHELLRMIDILRDITPKDIYGHSMFSLVLKCCGSSTKETHIDGYRSLFWNLWDTTPEELKQYLFEHKRYSFSMLKYFVTKIPFPKRSHSLISI